MFFLVVIRKNIAVLFSLCRQVIQRFILRVFKRHYGVKQNAAVFPAYAEIQFVARIQGNGHFKIFADGVSRL